MDKSALEETKKFAELLKQLSEAEQLAVLEIVNGAKALAASRSRSRPRGRTSAKTP